MTSDALATVIAASIARRQTRGLVDDAAGLGDVVIHGRVDLLAVAADILSAAARQGKPGRKSWAAWFVGEVEQRRDTRRKARARQKLLEDLENSPTPAEMAILRMRLRAADS